MYKHYIFWLALVSLGCFLAERVRPWRREQPVLRRQIAQDYFWLVFNGHIFAIIFARFYREIFAFLDSVFAALTNTWVSRVNLLSGFSLLSQFLIVLIVADFIEWLVHNLLHRTTLLWKFHRVHHSIVEMDWIGNFRFHWLEAIIYNTIKYLPLAVLGARWEVMLLVAVVSTTIGHLNHSNLNISWGPLRYLLNSPRMHIWHHDKEPRFRAGVNFAIVFSLWDWLFRTAYMPDNPLQPLELGFSGQETVPSSLFMRFFVPFIDRGIESKTHSSNIASQIDL